MKCLYFCFLSEFIVSFDNVFTIIPRVNSSHSVNVWRVIYSCYLQAQKMHLSYSMLYTLRYIYICFFFHWNKFI